MFSPIGKVFYQRKIKQHEKWVVTRLRIIVTNCLKQLIIQLPIMCYGVEKDLKIHNTKVWKKSTILVLKFYKCIISFQYFRFPERVLEDNPTNDSWERAQYEHPRGSGAFAWRDTRPSRSSRKTTASTKRFLYFQQVFRWTFFLYLIPETKHSDVIIAFHLKILGAPVTRTLTVKNKKRATQ